ncbi:MAG: tetratricopeptide repeat protein [Betaproteobacteria bacterium]|nr:tetratricopeptide repeat protein [Betaproteobacteria bacterium]
MDAFQKKNYDEALAKFKQAATIAPRSAATVTAYNFMSQIYQTKGDLESAIDVTKKALEIDNKNLDTHIALGKLYILNKQPEEARAVYEKALQIDAGASTRYYLGQAYMQSGDYNNAELQFNKIKALQPDSPYGDFGLGQTYAKAGRHADAIKAFEAAISRKPDYWDAYAEMGYVYADMGDFDQANKIATQLSNQYKQDALSLTLSVYIAQKTPPKMDARLSTGTFLASLGPGTALSVLGTSLATPNSQQLASIVFAFSGSMDAKSVENVANWDISRAIGTNLANTYNYGWAPPSTEALLPNTPVAVQYDKINKTATVYFNIYQNATGNGTIDPSHIQFSFKGVSVDGVAMDPTADEFTGFSGFF